MSSLGPLCAFASSITWAIGSTSYSKLARHHSAFAVNFCRALTSLPLFALVVMLSPASFSEIRAEHLGWFSISILSSYAIGDGLFLLSTRYLGVPGALAIASTFPIWTSAAAIVFWNEPMSWLQGLGIWVTFAGVVTVILNTPKVNEDTTDIITSGPKWKGLLLAGLTSVLWASNTLSVAQGGRTLDSAVANTLRMLIALLFIALMNFIVSRRSPLLIPFRTLANFWWVFILEAFAGSLLFMYGLSHSPIALGTTLASLAPVIAVPLAVLMGLEKPSLFRTLGVCLTVLGISLLVGGKPNL